jgi:superfamily II DNA or RNA helicase
MNLKKVFTRYSDLLVYLKGLKISAGLYPKIYRDIYLYSSKNKYNEMTSVDGEKFQPRGKLGQTYLNNIDNRVNAQDRENADEELEIIGRIHVPIDPLNPKRYDDHRIRRYLIKEFKCKPTRVLKDREWLQFPCKTKDEMIKLFYQGVHHMVEEKKAMVNFGARQVQAECIKKAVKYFKKTGNKKFLINAIMRFGKSFTAYEIARLLGKESILVLTGKPTTKQEWLGLLGEEGHINFAEWTGKDSLEYGRTQKLSHERKGTEVHFVSLQDFDLSKSKLKNIKSNRYDLVIIDEEHYGVETDRTSKILQLFPGVQQLYLSGTPYKSLSTGKFSDDAVYHFTYIDEQIIRRQFEQKNWKDDIDGYRWLVPIELRTILVDKNVKDKFNANVRDDKGWSLTRQFGSNKEGELLDPFSVDLFLDNLSGGDFTKRKGIYRKFYNYLKHSIWMMPPDVKAIKALAERLRQHKFFKRFNIFLASGDGVKDIDDILQVIDLDPDTPSITLSCDRFMTGTSNKYWQSILMLNDCESPMKYWQSGFRVKTPYPKFKESAMIFDFSPDRSLKMMFEMSRSYKGKKNISESLRELIDHMPILDEGCFDFKVADVEKILGRLKDIGYLNDRFSRETIINHAGLNSHKVISMLEDKDQNNSNSDNVDVNNNELEKTKNYNGKKNLGKKKTSLKDLKLKIKTATKKIPNLMVVHKSIKQFTDIEKSNGQILEITGLSSSEWSLLKNESAINIDEIDDSMATFANSYSIFQKVAI